MHRTISSILLDIAIIIVTIAACGFCSKRLKISVLLQDICAGYIRLIGLGLLLLWQE
ncbi:hypothetical protein V1527DRAFT_459797 [Lipomyces starkeyi]